MNLVEVTNWAKSIDLKKVPEKHRSRASCYKDMIVEKAGTIQALTTRIDGYMQDVQEYIGHLNTINVRIVEKEREAIAVKEEPKQSPLIPKEENNDKSVQKRTKDTAKSEKILPKPRVRSGGSKV